MGKVGLVLRGRISLLLAAAAVVAVIVVVLLLVVRGRGASVGSAGQVRFAIAQYVELAIATTTTGTQNGYSLRTDCGTESATSWSCTETYAPPNGLITSQNQIVGTESAKQLPDGAIQLKRVSGTGRNLTLTKANLQRLVRADGSSTGPPGPQSGATSLTKAELAKQSTATLSTLSAVSHALLAGGHTASASAPTTQTSTSPGGQSSTSTVSSIPTVTDPGVAPGAFCGSVSGGPDDFNGAHLRVYARPGLSCPVAIRVVSDLSSGRASNHAGASDSTSHFSVDGWGCPYGNMGVEVCVRGGARITVYDPAISGAAPPS